MEYYHGLLVALAQLITCYLGLKILCSPLFSSLPRPVVRKLLHIVNGPLHLLFWHFLDPSSRWSPVYSIITPLVLTSRIAAIHWMGWKENSILNGMSRSGASRELVFGPTIYGVVHILITLLMFNSVSAHVLVLVLCLGDGMAALVGQRFGVSSALPWNPGKSLAGSTAFFLSSLAAIYLWMGVAPVAVVMVAALVESLDWGDWDNLSVPLASYIACRAFL